jgi:hypothetical protein
MRPSGLLTQTADSTPGGHEWPPGVFYLKSPGYGSQGFFFAVYEIGWKVLIERVPHEKFKTGFS